ncbi:MAG: hypothetical protein LBR73_01280 [Oscillospiraceae bacterium]|jgi:hypothetical protein|nr:hypothetical protein [Oscillospiraceae bacterium]
MPLEDHIKSQIKYALRYLPPALVRYPFIKKRTPVTQRPRDLNGGEQIHGICHGSEEHDYDKLRKAGIQWLRLDCGQPCTPEGEPTPEWENTKKRFLEFKAEGFKILMVTCFPDGLLHKGYDPRTPKGEAYCRTIARFYITEAQGVVDAIQIGNELSIARFNGGIGLQAACNFIGVFAEEMGPLKGDILLGYNCIGPQADMHVLLKPWRKYLDYVGLDIYIGSFFAQGCYMWVHNLVAALLYSLTGLPVILTETGYLSEGQPKTKAQKLEILRSYGFESEKELHDNPEKFLSQFNEVGVRYVRRMSSHSESVGDFLLSFDFINHIYKQLPPKTFIKGCPHTPEGQAEFFRRLLPSLAKMDCVAGTFIYHWADGKGACLCGQYDCPIENFWGILDADRNPKPAYYAIGEAWGNMETPNAETLVALEEVRLMKANPTAYKGYDDVDAMRGD